MTVCTACGADNREGARFCDSCGASLVAAPPPRQQRKTVTVLQCDVTGSTALGERLDPESLRAALARYFDAAKAVIERHGGTVEKFIGDAVLAVFGVPVVHEDDALRAVRAAAGIRDAIDRLNEELSRDYGAALTLRIGVNTGEVVTGTAERLATGDAVVVAARLEQAAPPGAILLGEETVRLVRGAVEIGPLERVPAKGKAEPLRAHRVLTVSADAPQRAHDAPFVGREREQRLLADAWERACAERASYLFTVLGSAGVGKSRLTAEFLRTLADARVVQGRCLSYGDGITYWPVVEILKQLLGRDPAEALDSSGLEDVAAASLLGLLGEGEQPASPELVAWSVRKLLEAIAESTPVVAVLDDLQWAEPTLLDLVEHVADLSRGAPILLLCLARPDLLDRRPGWGGGKLNATTVLLEPLPAEECERLIDALLEGATLDDDVRGRILVSADGNPLFVEEMLALLRERGDGEVEVPPSIQALLAARLDQLDPSERGVLERGAVEGKIFHQSAVQALAPDESELPTRLVSLVRKELVRPERGLLPGDDAYRFRHLLIRDAAYEALPKSTRAELHERFADWLEGHGEGLVELDEIVGYHLEQAHRYRVELGPADAAAERLAARAVACLTEAAERAGERGDVRAICALLERAVALSPRGVASAPVRLELATAYLEHEYERIQQLAEEVLADAVAADNRGLELLARMQLTLAASWTGAEGTVEQLEADAREAIVAFESQRDERGLMYAWRGVSRAEFVRCRFAASVAATMRALEHARRANARSRERTFLVESGLAMIFGPAPATEALAWCEQVAWLEPARPGLMLFRARTLTLLGRSDEARDAFEQAEEARQQLGLEGFESGIAFARAECALVESDFAEAEQQLAFGLESAKREGQLAVASTYEAQRARALLGLGRDAEAEAAARLSRELGADDDIATQMLWRPALARVLARRGEHYEAQQLAREGVRRGDTTDMLWVRGEVWSDFAEVLELGGDSGGAAAALEQALANFEQKGVVPAIERTKARLAAWRAPA